MGFFFISHTLKTTELEEMIAIVKLTRVDGTLGFWREQLSQTSLISCGFCFEIQMKHRGISLSSTLWCLVLQLKSEGLEQELAPSKVIGKLCLLESYF